MLLYTDQQGIAHKHVTPEDVFQKGIMTKVVV
jgi:4,5-dihydroxyphthalate decarboxylase